MAVARRGDPRGERLLDIATAHVRQYGLARTTVVSIAREAGMTHANVYRYFPSKEALVDAVAAQRLREIEGALTAVADAPDPADDKLERLVLAYAKALRAACEEDPNLAALHTLVAAQGRLVARRHRQRVRTLIERVIEEGLAADTFRVRNRERAAVFVLDALHRFLDPHAVDADRDLPKAEVDTRLGLVTRAVLRALGTGLL